MGSLSDDEIQMVLQIINAVQVPGKVVEQVAEIKRKLNRSLQKTQEKLDGKKAVKPDAN